MPRLRGQILLRLRRVARRDFLPQLAPSFHIYFNTEPGMQLLPASLVGRQPGGKVSTLVILRCLTREFFFGAIWRGPGLGPRAEGLDHSIISISLFLPRE